MSDDYQIDIPPSFFAIYTDRRRRLSEPLAVVRERYEICEDLANHLVQQALTLHHVEVPSEQEGLAKIHAALAAAGSGFSPAEAQWVTRRLAELLNWRDPSFDEPLDSPG